jgi:hypothetical protein
MNQLRIILDKSVVFGLNNLEVDSLDRYFFQIVPSILTNEILADLSKEAEQPTIANQIASHSYRISGSRGLTTNYLPLLIDSLLGFEIPMDGRYLPAGEMAVQSELGLGTKIETPFEDETINRWERKEFTPHEKRWSHAWRRKTGRPLTPNMYLKKIAEAGLEFTPPRSDKDLVEKVDALLQERNLQGKLLNLVFRQHDVQIDAQNKIIKRWFKAKTPMIQDFAPYAFFCIRADFLWILASTNPGLFLPDENDRKDLEYCYYLPRCEIFATKDRKHKRLVPFLLRPDQSLVDGEELKKDLRKLAEEWDALSREEKIQQKNERGNAPPEDELSLVFQLWKKFRNEISKPLPRELLKMEVYDSSLPPDEQRTMTFEEMIREKFKEIDAANQIPKDEMDRLREKHQGADPTTYAVRTTKISKARLLKMYPELTEADLDKA